MFHVKHMLIRNYTQHHPVSVAFHNSPAFIRGLMGPIGSGKSVACCMEIMRLAAAQTPNANGIRRTRWAVIRNSYPELRSTTIKTWLEWIPKEAGTFRLDSPITHHIRIADIDCEVLFLALDKPDDVKKLLSLEVTGVWINEAREVQKAIVDAASSRVGRFPPKIEGGCTWSGMVMDTNPPSDDHWWYRYAEELKPEGFEFFRQPSGLAPNAENIENLPDNYYNRLIPGKSPEWIEVYVKGNYGTIIDGKPVYPEWNDRIHVATEDLVPYRGLPIVLSWDFGLTPACIISQITPRGQMRVLDELVSEDMGIRQFANDIVKPFLALHYHGMEINSVGDPAGAFRSQTDERTCMDELKEAGLKTEPARTNDFTARRESVAGFLTRMVDGLPAFLLNPRCKVLRKGFNGGYHYRRMQVPGQERYQLKPDKNSYSHPHDALQYGGLVVEADVRPRMRNKVAVSSQYQPGDSVAGY